MSFANVYEKRYVTSRRATNDDHTYVLILFKNDNTFIIKKKSNLHGVDQNGLVDIKDRGKSYLGYCLFEGSLAEIEAAAERLDKQMNTDLESDCDTVISNPKLNAQRTTQLSTSAAITTNSSIQIGRSSTMKTNNVSKKKDTNSAHSTIQSLALTPLGYTSKHYGTPLPTDIAVHNKAIRETSPKQDSASAYQSLREVQNIMKNKEKGRQTRKMLTFDDDCSDDENTNDKSCDEAMDLDNSPPPISITIDKNNIRPSKRPLSNSFITNSREKSSKRLCNKLFPSENDENKEIIMLLKSSLLSNQDLMKAMGQSSKDIKHLMVSVEKLDAKMNILFENQKKMQRALVKRKINVSLNGAHFGGEDAPEVDAPFQSTLMYTNQGGDTTDLIQLYGVRTQLGRFAALVMDHLFTKEALTSISKDELIKDERYQTIKEAVRSRFKLNHESLNSEWPSVHESILQKRRNEIKKRKDSTGNVKSAQSVSQATEEEHFDEMNTSYTF